MKYKKDIGLRLPMHSLQE